MLEVICYEMLNILLMQEAYVGPVKAMRFSVGVTKMLNVELDVY